MIDLMVFIFVVLGFLIPFHAVATTKLPEGSSVVATSIYRLIPMAGVVANVCVFRAGDEIAKLVGISAIVAIVLMSTLSIRSMLGALRVPHIWQVMANDRKARQRAKEAASVSEDEPHNKS